MKNYTITVNGCTYEVQVEEGTSTGTPVAAATTAVKAAPKATPKAVDKSTSAQGSVVITAPMPGKILAVKATVGQTIKKGDVILVLEAMKMENEIVAPQDGTIASINAAAGEAIDAGAVLATLN